MLPPHVPWVTEANAGRENCFNGYCCNCSISFVLLHIKKNANVIIGVYVFVNKYM